MSTIETNQERTVPIAIGALGYVKAAIIAIGLRFGLLHRFNRMRARDTRYAVMPSIVDPRNGLLIAVVVAEFAFLVMYIDPLFALAVNLDQQDPLFMIITEAGQSWWMICVAAIVIALSVAIDPARLAGRVGHVWNSWFYTAFFFFYAVAGSGLIAILLKNLIGRARPTQYEQVGTWAFSLFDDFYHYASLPSGHATTAGALTVGFGLLFPRLWPLAAICGILVAISRLVLGVHYPSDVFAGVLFGGLFTLVLARYYARIRLVFRFDENGRVRPRRARYWSSK